MLQCIHVICDIKGNWMLFPAVLSSIFSGHNGDENIQCLYKKNSEMSIPVIGRYLRIGKQSRQSIPLHWSRRGHCWRSFYRFLWHPPNPTVLYYSDNGKSVFKRSDRVSAWSSNRLLCFLFDAARDASEDRRCAKTGQTTRVQNVSFCHLILLCCWLRPEMALSGWRDFKIQGLN